MGSERVKAACEMLTLGIGQFAMNVTMGLGTLNPSLFLTINSSLKQTKYIFFIQDPYFNFFVIQGDSIMLLYKHVVLSIIILDHTPLFTLELTGFAVERLQQQFG